MNDLGLQIYRKGNACAVVNKRGNYALCHEGEPADGFICFRQDGTWVPVSFADAPAWVKQQLEEAEEFKAENENEREY